MAVMMFRVVSNLIDLSCAPLHLAGTATRGHTQRFIKPFCHVKSYQDSFYPAGTVIWNSLPQDVINGEFAGVIQDQDQRPQIHLDDVVFIQFLNEPSLTWF